MSRFDLVVLGGGTAGLTVAHGAAGLGARVLLAERDRTGGDCLWTGCVPSKTLLATAALAHRMRHADDLGLPPAALEVDLASVMARVRQVQATIAPHDSPERLRDAGVDVRLGHARFLRPGVIEVAGEEISYRSAVVATGSQPSVPPIDGLESVDALTSDTLWGLRALPRRLVVLGGGPVGCESSQAFARLGSEVTLVEALPRLLHQLEPEASALVRDRLVREGVEVRLGATATTVRGQGTGGELIVDGSDGSARLPFDRLLVAVGRSPRTGGLGLQEVDVETDATGHVVVDDRLATTGRRIFAAGDVCGGPAFTHVAAYEAGLVVTNALFHLRRKVSYEHVPSVTYTDPEVAQVGLTEAEARQRHGDDVTVACFDHQELDRALAAGGGSGFSKLVADRRGRLVGATVISPVAGETIGTVAALLESGGTLRGVSELVQAYPTFTGGLKRAADEHLRQMWFGPTVRALTRPALGLLRFVER